MEYVRKDESIATNNNISEDQSLTQKTGNIPDYEGQGILAIDNEDNPNRYTKD